MKQQTAIFLAAISVPLAALASILSFELRVVSDIRQSLGIAVLVILTFIIPAISIFFWGLASGRK